jgi:hypothetical protein
MLIERILHLLEKAEGYAHRVHMMVFPELSLTHAELDAIKNLLARHRNRDSIPLLVAGLREEPEDRAQSTPARSGFNKIVLSTFFGGKWYDLCQHKHHRWRLEEFQIKQYSLGGVLGAKQDWWEAIDIPQRRLMFLAPNGWLTLCPLICEDLARQEPVSDLIRGVGPTLLLAILLDGPQLPARWPGRYANVLADDPGTSVLTVSSLGMANLAHPQRQPDQEGFVALWKDQLTNWGHIRLKKGQEAAVVTLAASWYEEFTADGRGDRKAAAVFSLLGYEPLDGATPEELAMKRQEPPNDEEPEEYDSGEESDVSELTTFSFLADAALDVPDHFVDNFAAWARGDVASDDWLEHGFRPGRTVLDRFRAKARSSNQEFPLFVDWLASFLKRVPLSTSEHGATPTGHGTDSGSRHERPRPTRYWTRLVDATEAALRDATVERFEERLLRNEEPGPDVPNVSLHEALRAEIYTALAVLWAVHRRLARQRQESGLTFETTNLLQRVETLLREPYDKQWYRARNLTAPDSRSAAAPDGG